MFIIDTRADYGDFGKGFMTAARKSLINLDDESQIFSSYVLFND